MRIFWTDGSASPNPGPGGYAVLEEKDGGVFPMALGRDDNTTNIVMEGRALYGAMFMTGDEECEIHTDSEFWVNVLTKWAPAWERNGWKKKSGPIKNLELVKDNYELYRRGNTKLVWVRGHVGTEFNEKADYWANRAREGKWVTEEDNLPPLDPETQRKNEEFVRKYYHG